MRARKTIAVIGAGFFGLSASLSLAKRGYKVVVYERNSEAMQEASLLNQARVHGGYHYPRSLSTAARCRANYERFVRDYHEAITSNFESIYAIAADSKVNSQKFERLMRMINAPIERVTTQQLKMFDTSIVSSAFNVAETAFDSKVLLQILLEKLSTFDVDVQFNTSVIEFENNLNGGNTSISIRTNTGKTHEHSHVILTTYGLDNIISNQDFNDNFLYEVCELVKVSPPESLIDKAVTLIDGPYWSLTPWPTFQSHVLTHVRYTPHARFNDYVGAKEFLVEPKISRAEMMIRDAVKYVPEMARCEILGSQFTVKTILKKRDYDDARPIYVSRKGNILSILGSKIDNVYEIDEVIENFLEVV